MRQARERSWGAEISLLLRPPLSYQDADQQHDGRSQLDPGFAHDLRDHDDRDQHGEDTDVGASAIPTHTATQPSLPKAASA